MLSSRKDAELYEQYRQFPIPAICRTIPVLRSSLTCDSDVLPDGHSLPSFYLATRNIYLTKFSIFPGTKHIFTYNY